MKNLKDFIKNKVAEPIYHTAFVGFFRPGEKPIDISNSGGDGDHDADDVQAARTANDPLAYGKPAPDASKNNEYKPFFVGFFRKKNGSPESE